LGAAMLVWHKYLGNRRSADEKSDKQKASLLGPSYSDAEIEEFLRMSEAPHHKLSSEELPDKVAELVASGNVVGWFQGRLEFGPRALGSRSIIGDSRNPEMQSRMNLKIKYRESFRPFAPTVLREEVNNWFEFDKESPYMLLAAPVKEDKRLRCEDTEEGFAMLKLMRSVIPAVTHVDYSARLQTVKKEDNPIYYNMINSFYKKTGCPVIINTSFNIRGEPLVCTPQDAFRCFMRTGIDYLAIGNFLLDKKEQKQPKESVSWQKSFEPD
ncbi:MAG: carbamoyltransferase C-terminal domain-containing protein, partial [Candidatus Omnitrophota bacterium]